MIEKVLANASVRRVVAALTDAGIAVDIIVTEEATPSSQAAADKHGCDVAQIAKSVIFRAIASDRVVLVITSGANRVDEARVARAIGEPIGRADAAFVNFTVLTIIQSVFRSTRNTLVARLERRRFQAAGWRSSPERGAGDAGEPRGRKLSGKAGISPRTGCCAVFFGCTRRSVRMNPYAAIDSVA